MTYFSTTPEVYNRYRVRIVKPHGEKVDDYIEATSSRHAHKVALKKWGEGHRAMILSWEPS